MKYLVYIALPLLFVINNRLSAQNNNELAMQKALQGLWALSGNPNITLCICGDTLVEFSTEDYELGVFKCILSEKPCDNEEFTPSPTGIYFSINYNETTELCAALAAITDRYFKLQIDKETAIQFEKIL